MEERAREDHVRALVAGDEDFGLAGWRQAGRGLGREEQGALELLADAGAAAIARARLAAEKGEAETRARTEDLRNALLSSISHDLRTPLAAIVGSATSLRRFADEFDVDTRRDLASTIEEEASRLDAFVSNLLQMTRLQAGNIMLGRIGFSLPETVDTVVAARLKTARAALEVTAERDLPEALGDPGLFQQALGNVVDNALRYAGSDGPVTVDIARRGSALQVRVADRGPGVPEAELEQIFEKFFRSAAATRQSGTGLGLAIARGLMDGMGGSVSARLRDGGGLVVELNIPAVQP